MSRFHATPEGNIPFTAAEETERDAEEQAFIAGADDREAESVRSKRNSLLAETDWQALSDVTMSAEMTTYRQALRDVPQQDEFPNEINWPESP